MSGKRYSKVNAFIVLMVVGAGSVYVGAKHHCIGQHCRHLEERSKQHSL